MYKSMPKMMNTASLKRPGMKIHGEMIRIIATNRLIPSGDIGPSITDNRQQTTAFPNQIIALLLSIVSCLMSVAAFDNNHEFSPKVVLVLLKMDLYFLGSSTNNLFVKLGKFARDNHLS